MIEKALSQDDRERYNNDVCNKVNDGRKCKTEEYMETMVTFGNIFCGNKLPQRTDITTAIKNGVKINDIMTLNMEALMRTIIDSGCRRDWPGYLNSAEYKNWFKQQHGTGKKSKGKRKQLTELKKPVSFSTTNKTKKHQLTKLYSHVSRNVISHTQATTGRYIPHQKDEVGITRASKDLIISLRKYTETERRGAKILTQGFLSFVQGCTTKHKQQTTKDAKRTKITKILQAIYIHQSV